MKKVLAITCIMGSLLLAGCYKDELPAVKPVDPTVPPQNVSFSTQLAPMFNTKCASSGCHDAVPTKKPSLTTDKSYQALKDGGYINTADPASSGIYLSVKNDFMPPSAPLTPAEKQMILDWIRNGAPDN